MEEKQEGVCGGEELGEENQMEELLLEDGVGDAGEEGILSGALEKEEKEDFEVRVFRMALPMSSKSSLEVAKTAMWNSYFEPRRMGSTLVMCTLIKGWSFWVIFTSGW